jgi:arginine/lysine/ornithine decarboxylase
MLVDEAHGSHLRFHPDLPPAAVTRGADLVVQSTHKTQGALTQTSMLHLCGQRADRSRVAQSLAVLQSSSPNSILLASLDAARMQMATEGERLMARAVRLAAHARDAVRAIPGLWCYGDDIVGTHGIYAYDPTKLVIRVSDLGLTGLAVSFRLRREFGQDVEFADLRHIICSITIGDDEASIEALLRALRAISADAPPAPAPLAEVPPPAGLPEMVLTPRAATFAPSKCVPIEQSAGEVCAESIIPYPPGIPMLVPGERIAREHLDYLAYIVSQQMAVVGPQDTSLRTVRVVSGASGTR